VDLALTPVDRNRAEPLYLQIRQALLRAILEGGLQPHQRVPSERELSEALGVSRMTVRQALQTLTNEGYLYTVPGKGTFVAPRPRIEHNLQRLSGFTQEVRAQGFIPSSRVVALEAIPADDASARALRVPPGTRLFRLTRQRLVDGAPVALESAHLVYARFPGLDQVDFQRESLYAVLENRYGLRLTYAIQIVEAREASPSVAPLLHIDPARPVLAMERTTYAHDGTPVEYVRSFYRADRIRLKVELHINGSNARGRIANVYQPHTPTEGGHGPYRPG